MARKPPPPGSGEPGTALDAMGRAQAVLDLAEDEAREAERHMDELHQELRQLFKQVVTAESGLIRGLSRRLVGSNDADDVAQETFVSLMKWLRKRSVEDALDFLRCGSGVRPLLCTIAIRRAFDARRRRHHAKVETDGDIEGSAPDRAVRSPHVGFELLRLETAYEALPPMQRIAHVLHYHYGFTDADLSATLEIAKSTCRTLIRRARLMLKSAMEDPT